MLRTLAQCLATVLLFCLGLGFGQYALAPDGAYGSYGSEDPSHDWGKYLWFFQVPAAIPMLLVHGALIGILTGAVIVPVAGVVAAIMIWRFPGLHVWLAGSRWAWLSLGVFFAGLLSGAAMTILAGRNPGII
jgi:hypothetical protein